MVGNHVSVIDARCLGGSFWSVAVPLSRHFLTAALFGKFPSSPNGYPCGPQPKYESSANRKPGDISPALNSHAHALLVVLVHRSVRNLPFVDVTWLCQFSSICRIPRPKQLQESRSRWLVHSPRCRIFPPTLAMRVSGNNCVQDSREVRWKEPKSKSENYVVVKSRKTIINLRSVSRRKRNLNNQTIKIQHFPRTFVKSWVAERRRRSRTVCVSSRSDFPLSRVAERRKDSVDESAPIVQRR